MTGGWWVVAIVVAIVIGIPIIKALYFRVAERHLTEQERGRNKNLRRAGTHAALAAREAQRPVLTCPTCGSHQVERQSAAKKVGKIAAVGVFGIASASKQFKCRTCRGTW